MKYKPYPEYKDSGIEWIGKVPEMWKVHKLKRFSRIETGNTPPKEDERYYENGDLPWIRPGELKGFLPIFNSNIKLNKNGKRIARKVPKNTILVCCIGSLGKIGIAGEELATNQQINSVILDNKKCKFQFAKYIIFDSKIELERIGNANVVLIVNKSQQGEISYCLPPLSEQITIAKFLDKKTARIDALIEKDKKLTELLKEKRTALINHCVRKGLDPNAKMKDSRVEWIGEIPEGWEVHKIKYNIYEKKVKDTAKNPSTKFIGLEHIESETGKLISSSTLEEIDGESIRFKENNVLFGKLRPYLAKVIKVDFRGSCTGELIVYETGENIDPKFLFYRLLSKSFIDLVNSITYGVKMPRVDPTQLSNIKIAWPPYFDQTAIINFLDKATAKIDKTIHKIQKKIELLEEYKKSLIHHAVTGKIDVREL